MCHILPTSVSNGGIGRLDRHSGGDPGEGRHTKISINKLVRVM